MIKRKVIKVSAVILAVLMPVLTASVAFAQSEEPDSGGSNQGSESKVSKYDKLDINELTGHGKEPEDISVSAGATYQEKAWYEYVTYSEHAVASYRVDDDTRLLFYDPFNYSNSLVMNVEYDANTTEFDTMSSYSISHSNSKTIEACVSSIDTYTSATQTSGRDETGSSIQSSGSSKTNYNHELVNTTSGTVTNEDHYEYKKYNTTNESLESILDSATEISLNPLDMAKETITIGLHHNTEHNEAMLTDTVKHETKYGDGYKTTTAYTGDDTVENNSSSTTEGWTQLSARVTKTIGSSSSTSSSWSETESTTITKTYAATHFASDGVTPLPWAIVHYQVQMPMKTCLQVKYSGEWTTLSTVYCLLTTVQGTCRAWMQNGQTYYEDWGNGEPVVETEFWSKFMTRESLMAAYNDKLYPVGGED